jgi:branched-chain amino acid transport system ATP-binding protein
VSSDTEIPVLELKSLCKSFGGLQATRDVTLRIMPGDRKAIIGPNGAGKTTLFNLITGIYPVTSGQVLLFGQDVTTAESPRTALGMARTFQITHLFPGLTVLDNVLLAIGLRRSKFVMWRFLSSYKRSTTKPIICSNKPGSWIEKTRRCVTLTANSASSKSSWASQRPENSAA